MRFTSTLDLQRALERTLRRAGLNISYTLGFNPHPRLSLAAALPLGITSDCELVDIWLSPAEEPPDVLERLRLAQPPGLEIDEVARVTRAEPALQAQIVAAEYLAVMDPTITVEEGRRRVDALLAVEDLPRERRGKIYDLRPLVEALVVEPRDGDACCLRMRLASREGATGRPDEVLMALGFDPSGARVRRTRLFLSPSFN